MLVIAVGGGIKGINSGEFIIANFLQNLLPISNLSLKTISFTHFTNKINIIALHMKYFRQCTEPGRFKLYDSRVAKLKAFSGIQQMWFTKRID